MAMYAAMAWDMCVQGVMAEIQRIEEYTQDINTEIHAHTTLDTETIKLIMSFLDPDEDYKEAHKE